MPGSPLRKQRYSLVVIAGQLLLFGMVFSLSVKAQEEPSASTSRVDEDVLRLKIEEVEASPSFDEQVAGTLLDYYRRALTNQERTRVEQSGAEAFEAAGASAPGKLAETLSAIEILRGTEATIGPELLGTDIEKLEETLSERRRELNEAEVELAAVQERYANEVTRPALARARLAESQAEHDAAVTEANALASVADSTAVDEARRWHRESRAQRLAAEMRKLQQELLTYDARFELLKRQQELLLLRVDRLRSVRRQLEDSITEQRGTEAEQALEDAVAVHQELEGEHALVRELAAGNVELSDHLTQRTQDIQLASDQRDAARAELTRILEEFTSTRSKLSIAGLNQAMGQVLIEQRRALPDPGTLRKQSRTREQQVADVGLEQIELGEQRRALRDTNAYLTGLLEDVPPEEVEALRPELGSLVDSRIELIDQSLESGSRYLRVLGEFDLAQRQLLISVEEYRDFLDRKLLWMRNSAPIDLGVVASLPSDLQRFLSPSNWVQFFKDFSVSLRAKPWMLILFAVLFVLAFARPRFLARIDACGRNVNKIRSYQFTDSLWALVYTLLAVAPLPIVLGLTGALASSNPGAAPFSEALGSSLLLIVGDLLIIGFFVGASRSNGLMRKHCNWSDATVDKLRRELRWFLAVFPLLRLIGVTSFRLDGAGTLGGLAVLGMAGSGLALALLIFRLFTPDGGILRDYLNRHARGALAQTRPMWLSILLAAMPVLVLLWLAGYTYTGRELAFSVKYSFWLVLALMMLQGLLARWLLSGYQRLEFNAAIERRDAARAARRAALEEGEDKTGPEELDLEVEEPKIDFDELNSDSRFLLNTVVAFFALFWLWVIWAPIIPALGILEEIGLWTRTSMVNGETIQVPVTLKDILLAVIVGIITGVASKGIPSLLELLLLNKTYVTSGGRYTATTLLRYAIIGAGVVIVINMLGVSWSKAQWLVAALGVGIGFGLQEIVANFISGLVILFERPIRVGDIVTVGETSGVVTRIQIRATTIRDWDRRELLVPNKEFITGRLLNWSLSDNLLRLVIPVGIAYEGDVDLAMKLMGEAAQEHENVLQDPAPFVVFEEFGDNSLNLTLRAYLPSVENLLTTKSELHVSIRAKLEAAGITIAFPQRDVHLDASEPLEIRMLHPDDGRSE